MQVAPRLLRDPGVGDVADQDVVEADQVLSPSGAFDVEMSPVARGLDAAVDAGEVVGRREMHARPRLVNSRPTTAARSSSARSSG